MKPHPAIAAPLALLAACGVAWAQEPGTLSAGVGDLGTGAAGGVLTGLVALAINEWRAARSEDRRDKAQAGRDAERESLRRDIARANELHNMLATEVGRLGARLDAAITAQGQLHGDLGEIRDTLGSIRERMPVRP